MYVVVHGEQPPGDGEWKTYVDDMEKRASSVKGVLVYTLGAGPDPKQRKYVSDMWSRRGQMLPLALVTPSAFVRGVVTALNWMLPKPIKTFTPDQLHEALDFLGITNADRKATLEGLDTFRGQLGTALRHAG